MYSEGPINFAPTYKYEIGTNKYDRAHIPSYTDRVLWSSKKIEDSNNMDLKYY